MSIFGSIREKIFGHHAATPDAAAAAVPTPTVQAASQPAATAPEPTAAPAMASPAAPTAQPVDVAAILTDMASKNSQQLNWRQSIVDLMKLLGLDSGLDARKELAKELGYTADTSDSAAMNIWLHKQVMQKLAANGGKVPDDLK